RYITIERGERSGALPTLATRYPRELTRSAAPEAAPARPFPLRTITDVSLRASVVFVGRTVGPVRTRGAAAAAASALRCRESRLPTSAIPSPASPTSSRAATTVTAIVALRQVCSIARSEFRAAAAAPSQVAPEP